jgi:integrase/recombinase XerD
MNSSDQSRFNSLYQQHLNVLRLQGKADATIDAYSRAVRRVYAFFDCCPDTLNQQQLRDYFSSLVHSHSWSTVKLGRNGLQFFYRHIRNKPWQWVEIVAYTDIGKGRELGAEASSRLRLKRCLTSCR